MYNGNKYVNIIFFLLTLSMNFPTVRVFVYLQMSGSCRSRLGY